MWNLIFKAVMLTLILVAGVNASALERGDLTQAIQQSQVEITVLEIQMDYKTLEEVKTTNSITIVEGE